MNKTSTLKVFKPWILPEIENQEYKSIYFEQTLRLPPDCVQFLGCYLLMFKTEYWEKKKEKKN